MNYNIIEYDSSNIKILNNIEIISGNLIKNGIDIIQSTCNYTTSTSNTLISKLNELNNTVNSDLTSKIDNLNLDNIANGSTNKYIINNTYADALILSDDLTISGNTYLNGNEAKINSELYTSNIIDIVNNTANTCIKVTQYDLTNDVLNINNSTKLLLNIKNNGNIGIGTIPTNALDVNGNLGVLGNATIINDLDVSGNATITSDLDVSGNATITSDLDVSGNATITNDLSVNNNLGVLGNATITSDLDVSGNATITNDLSVSGNATITSDLDVSGNATITNDLSVSGNATITSDLSVSGNATITNDLSVSGNATITSDLSVSGNATITNDLSVNNNLDVSGNATITSDLSVSGNATITSDLSVSGNLTVSGTTTQLNTDVYATEKLEIEYNGIDTALLVAQSNSAGDIITASNIDSKVFSITSDGKISVGNIIPAVSLDLSYNTDALKLPKGNNSERNSIVATSDIDQGLIRYNTQSKQFEGFGAGNAWVSLGGVIDVDQDTKILAETSAEADNDELQFITAGSQHMIIKQDGKIGINTSLPAFSFDLNTVDGIKIPAGTEGEKPINLVTSNYGLIRFNTTSGQFEGFGAGGAWGSLGGVVDVDQDTKILAETSANADNDELQFYTQGKINMVIASDGFVGIGTESPSSILDIYSHNSNIFNVSDNEITTYKNIIPHSTNSIDLGSVDNKFREVFISNNSLWIGDEHKLAFKNGKITMKKRKKNYFPSAISSANGNQVDALNSAGVDNLEDMELGHWLRYMRTLPNKKDATISDIFRENDEDYELEAATDGFFSEIRDSTSSNLIFNDDYTNIGIGTTNPLHKLDVTGNIYSSGDIYANNKFGIGTTTPTDKLHIKGGNLRIENSGSDSLDSKIIFEETGYNDRFFIATDLLNPAAGNQHLRFGYTSSADSGITNANVLFNISGNGNVGIGNTSPSHKLYVNGNIYSSGYIYSNNNVGVKTTSPVTSLHVVGEIVATNKITSYYSDERLKTNIENIKQPLELIKKLNGFYYTPNELAESFGIKSSNREVGLSAQEVNKILPELTDLAPFDMCLDNDGNIKSKSGNNYLTISYERMIPVIIESLKELTREVDALKKENKILKEKIM
jgi:predicted acyltransferase (DUF342 family)